MPTENRIKDWFNALYSERGLKSMRPHEAYPVFLDYLGVERGERLLDVGCGTGFLLKEASERGLETYGVDLSREAAKLARRVSPGSSITVGNGEGLNFRDNFFDTICCNATLEHFLDMELGLREMRRVAKPGARFCFMVPNSNSVVWKVATRLGTFEEESNENALSLTEWSDLFTRQAFEILSVQRDRWWSKKVLVALSLNTFKPLERFITGLLRPVVSLKHANQFIFILKMTRSSEG